jgi:hypothetical protein
MKTRILKMILPAAVIMFAVVGAFASQTSSKGVLAVQTGYIDSPSPCSVPVTCNTNSGVICTLLVNGVQHQAFGKISPQATNCTKVLFRN